MITRLKNYFKHIADQAHEYYRWYRLWGTLPVWQWVRAAECFRRSEYRQAVSFYRAGLEKKSRHPAVFSARLDLSYCLYRIDLHEEALEQLEILNESGVDFRDAFSLSARLYLIQGRLKKACEIMARACICYPDDVRILCSYVHYAIYSKSAFENLMLAVNKLERLKEPLSLEDPLTYFIDNALAHYELRNGDVRGGERMLARVLASGMAPYDAVLLRGERLLETGRVLPARDLLARAMRSAAKDPRPPMLLAQSYLLTGPDYNPAWAVQLAELSCRVSRWVNGVSLVTLARAYEAKAERAKAQLFMERVRSVPSYHELSFGQGELNVGQPRIQKVGNF